MDVSDPRFGVLGKALLVLIGAAVAPVTTYVYKMQEQELQRQAQVHTIHMDFLKNFAGEGRSGSDLLLHRIAVLDFFGQYADHVLHDEKLVTWIGTQTEKAEKDLEAVREQEAELRKQAERQAELRQEAMAAEEKVAEAKTEMETAPPSEQKELKKTIEVNETKKQQAETKIRALAPRIVEAKIQLEKITRAPAKECTEADVRASSARYLSLCTRAMPAGAVRGAKWPIEVNQREHRDGQAVSTLVKIECSC